MSNIINLAELQALTAKLFNFARGSEDFNNEKLTMENFRNAYHNLEIEVDDYEVTNERGDRTISLRERTEMRVNRNS